MSEPQRVAVTVFMEVDGEWADPENVAVEMVTRKLSGDPKGMLAPCEIEVVTSRPPVLTGRVFRVMETGSAAASGLLAIRPSGKAFR